MVIEREDYHNVDGDTLEEYENKGDNLKNQAAVSGGTKRCTMIAGCLL